MDNTQNRTEAERAASKAGEGNWHQGSGQVNPGETKEQIEQNQRAAETDALGRDPADTPGHTRNERGELITDTAQPEGKGHGDGSIEERQDQVTGSGGVQRPREVAHERGVYDPGRVGLEEGDDRNPSDPASYADPADQRPEGGTSRQEPDTGGR